MSGADPDVSPGGNRGLELQVRGHHTTPFGEALPLHVQRERPGALELCLSAVTRDRVALVGAIFAPEANGDSTDDGTPGFGALVALVALIAAALLATRRND